MTRLRLLVVVPLSVVLSFGCGRKEEEAAPVPVATDTAAAAAAAAKAAREAIESDTEKAHALIAAWDGNDSDLETAKELIKSVLTRDRDYAPAYLELARLEYFGGYVGGDERDRTRIVNAGKFLKHAVTLREDLPDAHVLDARIHLELGEYDLAEESLERAELAGSSKEKLDAVRARIAGAYDDERKAVELARSVAASDSSPPTLKFEMLTFVGSRLAKQGFRAEAEDAYRKAIEQLPDSAWGHGNLASLLLDHDYIEAGLASAEKAYEIRPYPAGVRTLARASIMRGEQLYRLKKRDDAEQVIARLEEKIPVGTPDVDEMLGDYYYRLYEATSSVAALDKAIEKYRSVVAAAPDRPEIARTLDAAVRRRGGS